MIKIINVMHNLTTKTTWLFDAAKNVHINGFGVYIVNIIDKQQIMRRIRKKAELLVFLD